MPTYTSLELWREDGTQVGAGDGNQVGARHAVITEKPSQIPGSYI